MPNAPTRLLDLAAARDARYRSRDPDGDHGDLREAVRLTDQALALATEDTALTVRAHKLRGPMLVELEPGGTALVQAAASFRILVELTDPEDAGYERHLINLAGVQHLLDGADPRRLTGTGEPR